MAQSINKATEFKQFLQESQVSRMLKSALFELMICEPKPANPIDFICHHLGASSIRKNNIDVLERKLNILKTLTTQQQNRNDEMKQLCTAERINNEHDLMEKLAKFIDDSKVADAGIREVIDTLATAFNVNILTSDSEIEIDPSNVTIETGVDSLETIAENEEAEEDVNTKDDVQAQTVLDEIVVDTVNVGDTAESEEETVLISDKSEANDPKNDNVEGTTNVTVGDIVLNVANEENEYDAPTEISNMTAGYVEEKINTLQSELIEADAQRVVDLESNTAKIEADANINDEYAYAAEACDENVGNVVEIADEPNDHADDIVLSYTKNPLEESGIDISADTACALVEAQSVESENENCEGFAEELKERLLDHVYEKQQELDNTSEYFDTEQPNDSEDDTLVNSTLSMTISSAADLSAISLDSSVGDEIVADAENQLDDDDKIVVQSIDESDDDDTVIKQDSNDEVEKKKLRQHIDDLETQFLLSKSIKCDAASTPFAVHS